MVTLTAMLTAQKMTSSARLVVVGSVTLVHGDVGSVVARQRLFLL
jgi:ribosomal protein L35AE/L33A